MCHNAVLENEQIDKCIENGMPYKIIKTLKYTIRRRAATARAVHDEDDDDSERQPSDANAAQNEDLSENEVAMVKKKTTKAFQMKCPFAHGLITPTRKTLDSPLHPPTVQLSERPKQFPNMHERLPSQSEKLDHIYTSADGTDIINVSGRFEKTTPGDLYNDDILAKGTQFTRRLTFQMQQAIRCLQASKTYTLLTKTAQPAHMIAICIVSLVLLTVWPEIIDGTPTNQKHILEKNNDNDPSTNRKYMLALMAYLGAFSTHFGAQIWMTFVSGLSLYFSLPRHMFGQCQQILFPKYFAMNGVLSITMLILFVKFFLNSWTLPQCIQLGALSVTGAIEVVVRLYLAPPLLRLMHEKYKIEGTIGSGNEVGSLVQGDLIQCPHYQRIHKAFRRTHMTVAIGNLITMAASCLHLYYIAGQIHISL